MTKPINSLVKRKQAEDELRESEKKYQSLIQKVQTAIVLHDGNGRILAGNPMAQRLLGLSEDQLLGRALIDPEWHFLREDGSIMPVAEYPVSLVLASRQPLTDYVAGIGRPDREETTWVLVNAEPEYDDTGEIIQIIVSFIDITKRKRDQSIMQARLRLLKFAGSHSMDELLTATLNEIEALTGSTIGFYHFLESDQKTLSLQNWSTNTLQNMCTAEGKGSHYDVAQAGVWVDCINERRPIIHNDYASLPHRKGMPEGHSPVIREIVVPIFRDNLIKAIIGVGNKSTPYNESDVKIVSQLSDLSWDIAERKRAEEALHHLNRKLLAISNCKQVLMRAVDEQTLLSDICRIVCDEAGYRMAWVGYVEQDEAKTVRPAAWAGVEDGYLSTANITWADAERGWGPTGTAIRTGESACIQDFTTDPQAAPWRKNALLRGYRSNIALPIKDENAHTSGVLCIYSTEPNVFTPDEVQLLEELAGDLAFGVTTLHTRTERNRAEKKANQLAAIVQSSDDAIIGKTLTGIVTSWNRGAEKIYGYTESEMIGQPISRLVPPTHTNEVPQILETIKAGNHIAHYETVRRCKDGRLVDISLAISPIRDSAGKVVAASTIAHDITQRKQAENALRESEERYRLVFENSPVSIWEEDFSRVKALFDDLKDEGVTDIETYFAEHPEAVRQCADLLKVVDMNQATLALHGAANKKELLTSLTKTFAPESFDTFRHELVCLWNGETEMISDAVVQTLAGELRHVTVYFSVCPGYEETLSKVLVSLIDITERRQAEDALSSSEAELRTLIQSMTDIIIVGDSQGCYLKIVDTSPSLLYKPPTELLGKTLHEVFPKDQANFFLNHIRQALNTQKSANFEYSIPIGNKELWFNAIISPMSDDKFLMVARDITQRKCVEEEIQRLNQELEQRVLDRTHRLEAANKELEAFAYSVSHDLRAPLRHIDGFLELLQKRTAGAIDERSRHYMDTISDSARRMGTLIDDLLTFSRMGRYEMSKTSVDLNGLTQEVVRELAPETQGRIINWHIADLPTVSGDRTMLYQVLINLLSNALKFTRGRASADIKIGCQADDEETTIFIRDNGVGFDIAYVDKLFGVFQRLHRVDEFEGTGIGLANVRRIINRHGGRTWAEGKVDRGATFYFSLPNYLQET